MNYTYTKEEREAAIAQASLIASEFEHSSMTRSEKAAVLLATTTLELEREIAELKKALFDVSEAGNALYTYECRGSRLKWETVMAEHSKTIDSAMEETK